jgi:tetratricopeptide (TPR) repeat protein
MNVDNSRQEAQETSHVGKSDKTNGKSRSVSRFAEHPRLVLLLALAVLVSFPVIYLIIKSSAAPPVAQQSPAPQTGPDVAAMEEMSVREPSPENFMNLSLAYYQAKRYQDCISAARKSLSMKPDIAEAYNNISAAFMAMSLWDSAIFNATEAIRIEPDFQLAKNNLAAAQDQKQKLSEDIHQLEKSSEVEPTPEGLFNLSLAYYNLGRYQECITSAKKALKLKPDLPDAWNNICSAYNMLGRFEDGKAAGEQALRLRPDYQLARNNLNWSLRELGKKK